MNDTVANKTLKRWVRRLPASRMVYPPQIHNRAKYFFWRLYTPCHPLVREIAVALGVRTPYPGRQDFLLGTVSPGHSIQQFISHCIELGYGNHFVAWRDEGQVASLRYVENFVYQYHLRIFEDGEVRGHYEHTPECYPLSHLKRKFVFEDRRDVFYKQLGDFLLPVHNSSANKRS